MKVFIRNRNHQKLAVVIEGSGGPEKLAFVMHGLSGNKDEPHLRAVIDGFLANDFTVVSFDTTNTFGESDGQMEDATLSQYYADLEDVIAWASSQPWYAAPFVLAGHSFGGICTTLFAENYPEKIRGLAPLSSVISGDLTLLTPLSKPRTSYLRQWQQAGIRVSDKGDGRQMRLKWACMADRLQYSVIPKVDQLTMPVCLVVGSADDQTPLSHQRLLYDLLPGKRELHSIEGAEHTFFRPTEQTQLRAIFKRWAGQLSQDSMPT